LRLGLGNPDLAQELEGAYPCLPAVHAEMLGQNLGELEADREHGVQRAHRLLEDHRNIRPPQFLQFPGRKREEVAAAVQDLAARRHGRVLLGEQAQDRQCRHRLAAAGFPDQRDRAVHRYVEADALHRLGNGRPVEAEIHLEVADSDQGFGAVRGGHLSFGSSASRRASVNRLNPVTSSAMARVAAASCHQYPRISSLWASLSMLPQDTVSTPTPNPRKLSTTSDLMKRTTCSDSWTNMTWLTFGRICTNMRRACEAPIASAA